MKTIIVLVWFLITISQPNLRKIQHLKIQDAKQVNVIFAKYGIPYTVDSLTKENPFIEIRNKNLTFYIEIKNDRK
jgi:hypothetical protein